MPAAAHGHPRVSVSFVLSHALVPVLLGVVMAAAYVGGFAKPDPQQVPVDVVGDAPQATALVESLRGTLGDKVSLTVQPDRQAAADRIAAQETSAAYVLDADRPSLLVSSAASDTTAVTVERMFAPIALQQSLPLAVEDVVPTSPDDPSGQAFFFYLVALTVGAYGTGTAIGTAGASRTLRSRTGLAVGGAAANAVLVTAVAELINGTMGGHVWAIGGTAFAYALVLTLFGVGLHTLVGRFTTACMVILFVALNFTSAGGVYQPWLQPGLFAWLHQFWIGSGMLEAARKIVYFPDLSLARDLGTIGGWLVVAAALLGAVAVVERRRRAAALRGAEVSEAEEREIELAESVVS
ncbi:hypothetical protein [Rhodococcus sp. X156]|uniref:hypothetical protein n=1 Tax=Rhodococcus sp. X156 TaxID=2499145 RepID=UPI000FDC156A|nr:hypothetical protein [Rhodococcus sp. X156]